MYFEFAKKYHEAGLSLVNLHPIEANGSCGCGNPECKMTGKHPQNSNWQTLIGSGAQFELLKNYHEFDIHCTGFGWLLEDCHLVVDVDPKNGGEESFKKLCEAVPELKECGVGANTGGGGFHLYYRKPRDLNVVGAHKDYPGIDFKHRGGYVVAAGSLHKSGGYYDLDYGYDDDLTNLDNAPQKLLGIIEKTYTPHEFEGDFNGDLNDVIAHIPNNDEDYDTFIEVGMGIHDTDPSAFSLWDHWASKSSKYDEKDMMMKWNSFGKNPSRITIGTLIKMAMEHGYKLPARGGCEVFINDDHDVVDELNTDHIDVLKPHGIVGDIVEHINATAYRERPAIAVGAALWAVSCAMNRMYVTPDNAKISLITMCIATSGTGKDNPYQVAKQLLIKGGYGKALFPEMISSQDMYHNVFDSQVAFYAMDEAHKIFGSISDKNAPTYLKQVEGAILNLSTESLLTMRSKDASSFVAKVEGEIAKTEKKKEDTAPEQCFILDNKIEYLKKKLSYATQGLENPVTSIYATSTPAKLDSMISEETLASGLMGRTFVFREYEDFPLAKGYGFRSVNRSEIPEKLQNRFNNIIQKGRSQDKTMTWREDYGLEFWGKPIVIDVTPEALSLSSKIGAWFDSRAQQAHYTMQPVWARGFQLTALIASIMAVESAMITAKDLMYAFAMVKQDINTKTGMCLQSMGDSKEATDTERGSALAARLINICDVKGGLPPSKIKDKTKKYSEEDVKNMLDTLVDQGNIERTETEWNKRKSVKFKTIKNNFI